MSSPHTHTLTIAADDDDDNDICPVCDGQCTCSNNTASFYDQPSAAITIPSQPARDPTKPILKIKLPPSLLKRKLPQPIAGPSAAPAHPHHLPKRRGRPPKNPALRAGLGVAGPSTSAYQRPKPKPVARFPQKKSLKSTPSVRDGGFRKKTIKKRKRVDSSGESSSELTDIDHLYTSHNRRIDVDDDARSVQFPTFVSAISSTSSASSSDIGSLSGFETDSSIEAEEENFILAEERARVRRELLHGGEESMQKRRDTDWVIRPRQMSVGAASDDMGADSDATDDANDEDDEDDEDEEDDDEPDGEDTEDTDSRHGYAGLVTAWSDDEESSFDADLFFANLSDQESSGSSTQSDDGEDGDEFDLSESAASLIPHLRQGVGIGIPNLAFQVTEGWDGQVLFTNGLVESSSPSGFQNLLETAFLPQGPETSPSPGPDGDVDMLSTDADGEADEEGYEQDIDQDTAEAEGEGDTTDEELVGDDDLPNERAMSLFNTPFSFRNVASINPLSTLSPVSSPGPSNRRQQYTFGFPRPSDILAHRIMQWGANDIQVEEEPAEGDELELEPEEEEEEENALAREQKEKEKAARGGLPRAGLFEVSEKTGQAVIDGEHACIPSSYPKFTGRRGKSIKSMSLSISRGGRLENLRKSLANPLRPSSLPPPSTRNTFYASIDLPLSPSNEVTEETSLTPSAIIASPEPHSESLSEESAAQPMSIDLDDVLDASFLAGTEPANAGSSFSTNTSPDGDSARKYIQSLNRWGWGSDSGPDYAAYSNVMKSSPLSTMLWHNRNGAPKPQRSVDYVMSPELGPVKDGERTPTNAPQKHSPPFNGKSRKESRKERKLKKKKSHSPAIHHPKQHRLHHQHNHHPNSKFRSASSSQRGVGVPPLTI